jgi:hypothetical protein
MRVTLYVREHATRKYRKANHRTIYPMGTIFVLRYAGRWETLKVANFTEATVATHTKEIDLLHHPEPKTSNRPLLQRNGLTVDEEVNTYLANVSKLAPKTHAAYKLTLYLFQKSCLKKFVHEVSKQDLQAFDSFLMKRGDEDRTRANRIHWLLAFVHGTFQWQATR